MYYYSIITFRNLWICESISCESVVSPFSGEFSGEINDNIYLSHEWLFIIHTYDINGMYIYWNGIFHMKFTCSCSMLYHVKWRTPVDAHAFHMLFSHVKHVKEHVKCVIYFHILFTLISHALITMWKGGHQFTCFFTCFFHM